VTESEYAQEPMTEREREEIRKAVEESRRLGREAHEAMNEAVAALHRAARGLRYYSGQRTPGRAFRR
jgi:hypothetical protein